MNRGRSGSGLRLLRDGRGQPGGDDGCRDEEGHVGADGDRNEPNRTKKNKMMTRKKKKTKNKKMKKENEEVASQPPRDRKRKRKERDASSTSSSSSSSPGDQSDTKMKKRKEEKTHLRGPRHQEEDDDDEEPTRRTKKQRADGLAPVPGQGRLQTATSLPMTKEARRALKQADRALRRRAGIHRLRLLPADKQLLHVQVVGEDADGTDPASVLGRLHLGFTCYVCKKRYNEVHVFYDQLCPWCAALNYCKRLDRANLAGRVALVTGGRVKIGFQCALRLLRCGASVIVTTRFPNDAALRYHAERDFDAWKDRLSIYGLDLRGMGMVQLFTRYISANHNRLDIIINNAAQTIRRPPAYYAHLIPTETTPLLRLPRAVQSVIDNKWNSQNAVNLDEFTAALETQQAAARYIDSCTSKPLLEAPSHADKQLCNLSETARSVSQNRHRANTRGLVLSEASALSQVRLVKGEDDVVFGGELFPAHALDADGQQVDLRPKNTWSARAHEVSGVEAMEVHAINAVAPYIIASQLLPLMISHSPDLDKYVVNVSSMEGKFTRPHKDYRHPHTNMAKAALNMMTCTMAADYARHNVYINSVDTGWVTNEHAVGKEGWDDFTPPLDDIDGAARVLQPIFDGAARRNFMSGLFLKDYVPTSW